MTKQYIVTKVHLIVSVVVVLTAAVVYSIDPELFFEMHPNTPDEKSFYKAVSGLYLGFSIVWIIGLLKKSLFKTALISNIVFMLGLAFGRLLSIGFDGLPTFGLIYGTIGELLLGFYGIYALLKHSQRQS